jgi:WD40 repeat protein
VLGSGAGALAPPAPAQARPAGPAAAKPGEAAARADAFGDPLPPGALARLGTVRWRHGSGLSRLAFGADGGRVVTAGDGVVRVWDALTGRELRRWGRPAAPPAAGRWALSADGRRAAALAPDGTVTVHDADTGEVVRRIPAGRPKTEPELALSLDGQRVAVRQDRSVTVWDVKAGKELCRIPARGVIDTLMMEVGGQAMSLNGVGTCTLAFSPDGRSLAASFRDLDGGVQVFDLPSGKQRWQVRDRHDVRNPVLRVASPAFTADGKVLARIAPDGSVRLHETAGARQTGRVEVASPDDPPVRCALSGDGKRLAVATRRDRVRIYDVAGGKERAVLGEAGAEDRTGLRGLRWPPDLVFSPDGRTLAGAWGANALRLWDVGSGRPRAAAGVGHAGGVHAVAVSPDGKTVTTKGADDTVRVWDLAGGREKARFPVPADAVGSALSPDGRTLAVLGEGSIVLRDLAAGRDAGRLPLIVRPAPWWLGIVALPGGAFSPDGRRLAPAASTRSCASGTWPRAANWPSWAAAHRRRPSTRRPPA